MYELAPRAREGLPLPPTETTRRVVQGTLARSQRDQKVVLHNVVWMNNHGHLLCSTTGEPRRITDFTAEVKKKLTDSVRALLGRRHLRLWEENTPPVLLAELDDAIEQHVYLFLNPVRAGLVDSIDHYPGFSSWEAFRTCEPSVEARVAVNCAWYPVAALPRLPEHKSLCPASDARAVAEMEASDKKVPSVLELKPLAWLAAYGVTDPGEVARIRDKIIARVRQEEAECRVARGDRPMPQPDALARQPYMAPHTPDKRGRRIFLICANRNRRKSLLSFFESVVEKCRQAYKDARNGTSLVTWPPGTFIPWLPPDKGCKWNSDASSA